ncbi:unnamed protein product [Mucor fragilis]
MALKLPVADVTDMSRNSILKHHTQPEYTTKMRLLSYVAKHWDYATCYMGATTFTAKIKQYVKQQTGRDVELSVPVSYKSAPEF